MDILPHSRLQWRFRDKGLWVAIYSASDKTSEVRHIQYYSTLAVYSYNSEHKSKLAAKVNINFQNSIPNHMRI